MQTLADFLIDKNYELITNGTENHLLLVDLRNKNISGGKIEYICEMVDISLNKNSVFGDKSALNPGGIRIGTSALTTRGFKLDYFFYVLTLIHKCVTLALEIQNVMGKLVDFKNILNADFSKNCRIEKRS